LRSARIAAVSRKKPTTHQNHVGGACLQSQR
jgi:hypothetical protein